MMGKVENFQLCLFSFFFFFGKMFTFRKMLRAGSCLFVLFHFCCSLFLFCFLLFQDSKSLGIIFLNQMRNCLGQTIAPANQGLPRLPLRCLSFFLLKSAFSVPLPQWNTQGPTWRAISFSSEPNTGSSRREESINLPLQLQDGQSPTLGSSEPCRAFTEAPVQCLRLCRCASIFTVVLWPVNSCSVYATISLVGPMDSFTLSVSLDGDDE